MRKSETLDKQWHELMFLCEQETSYRRTGTHPKLLKLVSPQIETLARELGFSERQIQTREFRAERNGERIVRIIVER